MDIDKVQRTYTDLIDHMKAKGMTKSACYAVNAMVRKMVEKKGQYISYPDFYAKFIDKEGIYGINQKLSYYRTTVRHIWAFDEYDHLPDGGQFKPIMNREVHYRSLNSVFRKIVDEYDDICKTKMLNRNTIKADKDIVIMFLANMQRQGAETIEDISPQMLVEHFIKDGEYIRGNAIGAKLKKVLGCFLTQYPHLETLLKYIPIRKNVVKLHEIVPDKEIQMAKEALQDKNFKVSRCVKAIVSIVLYTGLRGSDVAQLTIDNIDWANDRIKLLQSKTKQVLVLPLNPIVGNLIYEYIVTERPNIPGKRDLFFNQLNVELGMNTQIISNAIDCFFLKLGIKRRRVRVIRHYIASKLLNVGTELAIISSILGHINPESLNHYFDMDIEGLRECGLDISMFPYNKDIFR